MVKNKRYMKEKIILAAMKVFSRYGFFRAPVHLIAKEAGVSKGLIFWYFKNKQELIMEVAKRSLPLEIIDSCLELGLSGREILECIGRGYIRRYENATQRNLLLHTMALESLYEEVAKEINYLCEKKLDEIAKRAFGELSTKGRIAVRAFFGGLMCYILRRPRDIDEETYLENLIDMVLTHQKRIDET